MEKEKVATRARYELPSLPHIVVHPSATAKNGKFNCSVATLSLLLDYRMTDNKEHSFEVSYVNGYKISFEKHMHTVI